MSKQRDNSTFKQKVMLRKKALEYIDQPVIMETHGGAGKLFRACYDGIEKGVVFEKDPKKTGLLALQRPTWMVYEVDCEKAIQGGAGEKLEINLLDGDPYGDPWPTITAFFVGDRERAKTLCVVVNDGLRHSVTMGRSWSVGTLK